MFDFHWKVAVTAAISVSFFRVLVNLWMIAASIPSLSSGLFGLRLCTSALICDLKQTRVCLCWRCLSPVWVFPLGPTGPPNSSFRRKGSLISAGRFRQYLIYMDHAWKVYSLCSLRIALFIDASSTWFLESTIICGWKADLSHLLVSYAKWVNILKDSSMAEPWFLMSLTPSTLKICWVSCRRAQETPERNWSQVLTFVKWSLMDSVRFIVGTPYILSFSLKRKRDDFIYTFKSVMKTDNHSGCGVRPWETAVVTSTTEDPTLFTCP